MMYHASADPAATFTCGQLRITVLGQRLLRIEVSTGDVEDRATLRVVNRRLPVPALTASGSGSTLTVVLASGLQVVIHDGDNGLADGNVVVTWPGGHWQSGDRQRSIGGCFRTLDGYAGDGIIRWQRGPAGYARPSDERRPLQRSESLHGCDGWALLDDSGSAVIEPSHPCGRPWPVARPTTHQHDLYLFCHGHDMAAAQRDLFAISGRPALPPRRVLGYWWSHYRALTDHDFEAICDEQEAMGAPIDMLSVDMEWHLPGWSGYSWDHDFILDPASWLKRLHERGIGTVFNLHPQHAITACETAFAAVCTRHGDNPADCTEIPFAPLTTTWHDSYFDDLLQPLIDHGVDHWWLDWNGDDVGLPGLDGMAWLGEQHWLRDRQRDGQLRSFFFSRWGGAGSQRRSIGFSGDCQSTWAVLASLPELTAASADAGFACWSHDIGGYGPGACDGELYLRWLQFGVYSAVLRTHGHKAPGGERRFAAFPEPIRRRLVAGVRRRHALVPFIQTAWHRWRDQGIALLRPCYHDWPDEPSAFHQDHSYCFGDHLVVAPVVAACDRNGLAPARQWVPPGCWYDTIHDRLHHGPVLIRSSTTLDECPVLARAGSVLIEQDPAHRCMQGSFSHLRCTCWPGDDGSGELIEDDGISADHATAIIRCRQQRDADGITVTIAKIDGDYPGFLDQRSLCIRLPGCRMPTSVTCDGQPVAVSIDIGDLTPAISTPINLGNDTVIRITTANQQPDGLGAWCRRLRDSLPELLDIHPMNLMHPDQQLWLRLARTGERIARDPLSEARERAALQAGVRRLPAVLAEWQQRASAVQNHDEELKHMQTSETLGHLRQRLLAWLDEEQQDTTNSLQAPAEPH